MNRPTPFTDSEGETHDVPAVASKKTSKTTKVLKAVGIKKTSDAPDVVSAPTPAPVPVPAPAPAPAPTPSVKSNTSDATKSSKTSAASKKAATSTGKKAPAARKKPANKATRARKHVDTDSSEEFDPDSDDDYEPADSDDDDNDDSDFDLEDSDDDSDDDVDSLTDKLASVKIKSGDPTLPPKPKKSSVPKSTKLKRSQSRIVNANTKAILAPPKNKTNASTASGQATGGFWIAAPPVVKVPESTLKILSSVRDKLRHQDSSSSDLVPGDQPKKTSGLFKYSARVQDFFSNDGGDHDSDSKHTGVRKIFGEMKSLFHRSKHSNDDDVEAVSEKPLPGIPTSSGPYQHRPSVDSGATADSDVSGLSTKADDDEIPNQCQGYNTNGHRCKRRVKLDRPIKKGEVLMCHDHEVNEEDEVVVHIEGKGGVMLQWLDLSSWVNPNLPDYVQVKLRKAMERPVSETDKPGYIYAYQLVETRHTPTHTLFKVGRTDNVYRRMSEWSDKCGSPPRLIEVFPEQGSLAPRDENDLSETATKIADDSEVTGLRCRYSHRVERLIHIELKPLHDKDHICACKTNHREWFKVPNQPGLSESQQMKQAWGQVRRVIVHWMAYMEHVYGPG
ncbi:hypothetical protein BGZ98_000564 [Dissophora globulifera]|nr:hypothetical protein BGZ98_000564 [Dissophora globulifera]